MEMNPTQQQLLNSFLELCDSLVEDAFVVTNGRIVAAVVLEETLAKHICRKCVQKATLEEKKSWVVCNISNALDYAFECGYRYALRKESCEEVAPKGEGLAQETRKETDDSELRERELQ